MTTKRMLLVATLVLGGAIAAPAAHAETRVNVTIDGAGTVTSDVGGINCTRAPGSSEQEGMCYAEFPGDQNVVLTATPPNQDWEFVYWTTCNLDETERPPNQCLVQLNDGDPPFNTTAVLGVRSHGLYLTLDERNADGMVEVDAPSIPDDPSPEPGMPPMNQCEQVCGWSVARRDTAVLRAFPKRGSSFTGWSGDCTGDARACSKVILADKHVTARFRPTKLEVSNARKAEGNGGVRALVFTVRLPGIHGGTVRVDFKTVDGTAKAGEDYLRTTGTLVFRPNDRSKEITVPVSGDRRDERDETVLVKLSKPTNATIADGTGRGLILNDD